MMLFKLSNKSLFKQLIEACQIDGTYICLTFDIFIIRHAPGTTNSRPLHVQQKANLMILILIYPG